MNNGILLFGQIAPRLSRLGYQPIPLYPETKEPAVNDWPNYHFDKSKPDNRSQMFRFGGELRYPNFATGIVTGEVIGLDIDVRDPKIVRKLKALADRLLGPGPDRVGAAPKFLRVYRTKKEFQETPQPQLRITR